MGLCCRSTAARRGVQRRAMLWSRAKRAAERAEKKRQLAAAKGVASVRAAAAGDTAVGDGADEREANEDEELKGDSARELTSDEKAVADAKDIPDRRCKIILSTKYPGQDDPKAAWRYATDSIAVVQPPTDSDLGTKVGGPKLQSRIVERIECVEPPDSAWPGSVPKPNP